MSKVKGEKICCVGSGLVGRSWAMIFAAAGYDVVLYDISEKQTIAALEDIKNQLKVLEKKGVLKGTLTADEQYKLISATTDLKAALKGAKYCQESVWDDLELKKKVHSEIDEVADPETLIGSSASYLHCSSITEHLKNRHRVTVAHPINPPLYVPLVELSPAPWTSPDVVAKIRDLMNEIGQAPVTVSQELVGYAASRIQVSILNECYRLVAINPPYYVPLVELSPAPWTSPEVVTKVRALMNEIGQAPVTLNKEVTGFAINRIQVSILNECYRLVAGGVMSVEDVDTVMHSGLGPRYAFLGPLSVAHLNAEGMKSYIDKFGNGITNTANSLGPIPEWSNNAEGAQKIVSELEELLPSDRMPEHWKWRDARLMELSKLKKDFSEKETQ